MPQSWAHGEKACLEEDGIEDAAQGRRREPSHFPQGSPGAYKEEQQGEMGHGSREQVTENLDSQQIYPNSCRLLSTYYVAGPVLSA